jgi:hypothetical protein
MSRVHVHLHISPRLRDRDRLTETPPKISTPYTTLRTIYKLIIHMWESRIEPIEYPNMQILIGVECRSSHPRSEKSQGVEHYFIPLLIHDRGRRNGSRRLGMMT